MPIAYKIKSPSGAEAFLFGVHHLPSFDSRSPRLSSKFSIETEEAFKKADYCMFELPGWELEGSEFEKYITTANKMEEKLISDWKKKHLSKKQNMSVDISDEEFETFRRLGYKRKNLRVLTPLDCLGALNRDFYMEELNKISPNNRMEVILADNALEEHKEILGLESFEAQAIFHTCTDLSYDEQLQIFKYGYQLFKNKRDDILHYPSPSERLLSLYDQQSIEPSDLVPSDAPPLWKKYQFERELQQRDPNITENIYLKMEKSPDKVGFIAVGAGHLTGIVTLLKAKNFTIEPVNLHLPQQENPSACLAIDVETLPAALELYSQTISLTEIENKTFNDNRERFQGAVQNFSAFKNSMDLNERAIWIGYLFALYQFEQQIKNYNHYDAHAIERFVQKCISAGEPIYNASVRPASLATSLSKIAEDEAELSFRGNYKIWRILADIFMLFLLPVGLAVASVKYHFTGNPSFYFFKTNREIVLQNSLEKSMIYN